MTERIRLERADMVKCVVLDVDREKQRVAESRPC